MKTEYWTKQKLYEEIDKLKYELGLEIVSNIYPIDSKQLGKNNCRDLIIEEISFPSQYICGILYKGDTSTSIALNANREQYQQNFDCMHELIHYFLHDTPSCLLMCSDKNIKQDLYIEWQANEGAAQFLVPYQVFIPKYIELERKYAHSPWEDDSIEELAEYFNVSYNVIKNRINSLEIEISQYKNGTSIDSLMIVSRNKIYALGLKIPKIKQLYCKRCLSIIHSYYNYCPICGNDLINHTFFKKRKREGVGFMIYKSEIELDENKKAKTCPRCENEEILEGNYCKICGLELFNKCTQIREDEYGNQYYCDETCDANARYCHKCGSPTSFYTQKLLKDYNYEKNSNNNSLDNNNYDNSDDLPF